jgi:signal transduction histidine kinase
LQLVLARSECLALSGRKVEAADILLAATVHLRAGRVGTTFEEERFFLSRGKAAATAKGPEALLAWDETARIHRERELSAKAISMLSDWAQDHGLLEGPAPEAGRPQHFFERELQPSWAAVPAGSPPGPSPVSPGAPALLVWSRTRLEEGKGGPAVVGFRADPSALEAALTDHIAKTSPETRLAARLVGEADATEFLPLTHLSGDRSFLSVGFERKVWEALVGEAQKPFAFAGVLIGSLAVLLTLGFLVFLRGVRREMALSRMKTEFVANVSHELKTPLALIRLFGETLLLDRVKSGEQRQKYYHIITRESERLAHLISNILNFASIEAGKKSYELRPCNVGEVVRETYDTYKFHLDEKGFTHELRVDPGLPEVLADPDAVAQALINLLENAVKYSPHQKQVRVQVGASDGRVRLSVSDRGVGISEEDQARVWEDYYRAREARALGTRGSGLGLSVVRHIVRAHKGSVELESRPGIGSTFTLVFPAARGEGVEGDPSARSSSRGEDDPGGEP